MNKNIITKEKLYQLHIKTFSYKHLHYFSRFLDFVSDSTKKIPISNFPISSKKITLLRSPHKYKKAQEHFSINIFTAKINVSQSQFNTILPIIINKPYGTFIKVKILNHIM